MVLNILVGTAVLLGGAALVVASRRSDFHIARSILISAPAPVVFAQVDDFHNWEAWNPWGKIDPAMKVHYDGAPSGVGAVHRWAGNREVGEGRMTIIESRPSDLIRVRLEFFKPFAATNIAEFNFKPDGDQTAVTWSMTGEKNFMAKAVHLVMNMDKMIGGQFEKGLADLKAVTEASARK